MTDQITYLILSVLAFAALFILFIPPVGLVFGKKKPDKELLRIQIEDALKHIYDCEYTGVSGTIHSLAGNLNISGNKAAKLVAKLEALGLVRTVVEKIELTPEGRSYALRVIRVHRLWERYLADETGISEIEWHGIAEEKEHKLTLEEADQLAARLGNPVFDPHGDPIPSSKGEIPAKAGVPLSSLKEGESGVIIHIEDEPHEIYSQIVAEGLYPGKTVRIIESKKERIKFDTDTDECILAPSFASHITVDPVTITDSIKKKNIKRLSSLKSGEKGTVVSLSKAIRGQQRRRLMDLGLVPGTEVKAELLSLGGDPAAYIIRDALVALRKQQADNIFIKENGKEENGRSENM